MKLTRKEAQSFGIHAPPGKKRSKTPEVQDRTGCQLFLAACKAHDLPEPVQEYAFATELGRKWRFDWLWDGWMALEIQGGNFLQGRHTNAAALKDEYEKINTAALLGYTVLFCTPEDVQSGAIFAFVRKFLEGGQP